VAQYLQRGFSQSKKTKSDGLQPRALKRKEALEYFGLEAQRRKMMLHDLKVVAI
jgi:hypothetical protein